MSKEYYVGNRNIIVRYTTPPDVVPPAPPSPVAHRHHNWQLYGLDYVTVWNNAGATLAPTPVPRRVAHKRHNWSLYGMDFAVVWNTSVLGSTLPPDDHQEHHGGGGQHHGHGDGHHGHRRDELDVDTVRKQWELLEARRQPKKKPEEAEAPPAVKAKKPEPAVAPPAPVAAKAPTPVEVAQALRRAAEKAAGQGVDVTQLMARLDQMESNILTKLQDIEDLTALLMAAIADD